MFALTKENIAGYLAQHLSDFDPNKQWYVHIIGEDDGDESDGYMNYVFRVHDDGDESYIVKQSLALRRVSKRPMDLGRSEMEYDSIRIRHAIVPEYTPIPYFHDKENHITVMEDLSGLELARFALTKDRLLPKLAKQVGECLAKSEFYTSEFYLPREAFRDLNYRFKNTGMRRVVEDEVIIHAYSGVMDPTQGKAFEEFATLLSNNKSCLTERMKLRRKYMSHTDALIHGDFQTSNIFVSDDAMKVIDFEFSFMGPFGCDLGYFLGTSYSQYCAACFKPFKTEAERKAVKAYFLSLVAGTAQTYIDTFKACWDTDAKDVYQGLDDLRDSVMAEALVDAAGFAGISNWFRAASTSGFPEFDLIEDPDSKRRATTLSLMMDWQMVMGREDIHTPEDLIDALLTVEKAFYKMPAK